MKSKKIVKKKNILKSLSRNTNLFYFAMIMLGRAEITINFFSQNEMS